MSLLNGDIRAIFGAAFGSIYLDATLKKTTLTPNGKGGFNSVAVEHACKAHAPGRSEAYLAAAGFTSGEMEIIVLAAGLPVSPGTDDQIVYEGATYDIMRASTDGANSQWRLRAKKRNG